jgi:hypothetical protein
MAAQSLRLRNTIDKCIERRPTKFLQSNPVVAADALLEIGKAVISTVLSLHVHTSQTNAVSRNFVNSRRTAVLFGTSLSGYALLNALRTINYLDA